MNSGFHYLLLLLFLVSASCSTPLGRISQPGIGSIPLDAAIRAQDLVRKLKQTNMNLDTFKGIGSISIRRNGMIQLRERIAWVGTTPSQLRVVILAAGHPIVKLAGDGTWLYIDDRRSSPNNIRKIPAHDANLKWLIPISLRVSDLLSLLAGRISIDNHHSAYLIPDVTSGGNILVLKKWWWIVQKIYLDRDGLYPKQMDLFNWSGSLRYRVRMVRTRQLGNYRIPLEMEISNSKDTVLLLDVDRYWPNVPVSTTMFQLDGS